ncbi:MAG: hypothetical protein WCE30_08940 [Mycobacterium sp.]|jgi:hypothetical protein
MSGINVKLAAVIIGGSAVVGIVALYAGVSSGPSQISTANSSIVSFTPPPSTPSISVAVPGITGPAPMWAGEAPNANPQAGAPGVG